ncbi:MAG: response regulator [bacterium]|nr:response regulator [bacterium]
MPPKKRTSLKKQLLTSHLSIALLGVVLLLITLATSYALRSSTHKLALISQPRMESLDHIDRGVYQSAVILQHYISEQNHEFRVERNSIWREGIFPSFRRLRELTQADEVEISHNLDLLIGLLAQLHTLQAQAEELAHQPENLPAQMAYQANGHDLHQKLLESTEAASALTRKQGQAALANELDQFARNFDSIDLRMELFLTTGQSEQLALLEKSLDLASVQLQALHRQTTGAARQRLRPTLDWLREFKEVCVSVMDERGQPTWNQTMHLQTEQLRPLEAQLTAQIRILDGLLGAEIEADAANATWVSNLSMVLTLVLIVVMLVSAVVFSMRKSAAITRPVRKLARASEAFAAGNLGDDIPVESNDELGDLTQTFNQMKNSLVESYGRFRAIVDTAVDGIITIDQKGIIESFNKAAENLTGYRESEALGRNVSILMPMPDAKFHDDYLEAYLRTGKQKVIGKGRELNMKHKDGSLRPVFLSVSETRFAGEMIFTGLLRDIRDQKALETNLISAKEEAQVANKLKSAFLANISHEIRTPMNGILGMTELALETDLTPNQRRYIQAANGGAKALLKLLNDILDLSKMEGAHMDLEQIDFNIEQLMEDTMETLSLDAQKKGLDFILHIAPQVPAFVNGDPTRIRQILVNLIGNAIKFTHEGEVIISVTEKERSEKNLTLAFAVKDTGIGIPKDRLARVFDSFTQTDGSTTRKYGGTGLGTTIAKQLVELMGGKLWVESVETEGTTFFFNITLNLPQSEHEERGNHIQDLHLRQVLVIDDNAANLTAFKDMLSSWDLAPSLADSAESARKILSRRDKPFDLLMIDVQMPETDGITLANQIKQIPGYSDCPVIFLFSFITPQHQKALADLGEPLFLFKPVKREELKERLLEADQRRHPLTQAASRPEATKVRSRNFTSAPKVLVVEDDPTNRLLVQTRLKSKKMMITIAKNGLEAVELFKSKDFDLILMDLQMPELNGYEASLKIRELEGIRPEGRVPILALSASDEGEVAQAVRDAGMDGQCPKPLDFDRLYREIDRLLGHPQMGQDEIEATEANAGLAGKHLIGLDLAQGLSRWGDSQKAYLDALSNFLRNHQGTALQLRSLAENREFAELSKLGHRLKGTAGNISANALAQAAKELEEGAASLDPNRLPAYAEAVATRLGEVITSIQGLLAEHGTSKANESYGPADVEAARRKLKQLGSIIERGEAISADRVAHEALSLLGDHPAAYIVMEMIEHIDNFDLDKAAENLETVIDSL